MKLKDILLEVESEQKVDATVDAIGQELKKLAVGVEDALEDAAACCMPPVSQKEKINLSEIATTSSCAPGSGCC